MQITCRGLDDALRTAYQALREQSEILTASRGEFRELRGVTVRLTNPNLRLSRTETRGRPFSALAELVWYLSGSNRIEPIQAYIPQYDENAEADGTVHGAYGPRLRSWRERDQLLDTINLLRKKPGSRRAVIQLFDSDDSIGNFKDIPCTTTLQFLRRCDKLNLLVTMRSNDAWLGLPHDIFCFTMIQEIAARTLGIDVGEYIHFAGSFHLYEKNRAAAKAFLDEGLQDEIEMSKMPEGDPWPSIVELITLEKSLRDDPSTSLRHSQRYWRDLGILLQAQLTSTPSQIRAFRDELNWQPYRIYVEELASLRERSSAP